MHPVRRSEAVDCRNATAEIKELFWHLSHSSHGPGSQLPLPHQKQGHTDHLLVFLAPAASPVHESPHG